MELARISHVDVNIATEAELFTYTYNGNNPREIMTRIDLGTDTGLIAGGATYTLRILLNAIPIVPEAAVRVPPGVTKAVLVSRTIPVNSGDVMSVRVVGAATDTAVDAVISVRDITPIRVVDVLGDGTIPIDHNYGGADAMTVEFLDGRSLAGAHVVAYRADDYNAGRRTPDYVLARTLTGVDGRWLAPLMLDPGNYILLIYKQGVIDTKSVNLTVR